MVDAISQKRWAGGAKKRNDRNRSDESDLADVTSEESHDGPGIRLILHVRLQRREISTDPIRREVAKCVERASTPYSRKNGPSYWCAICPSRGFSRMRSFGHIYMIAAIRCARLWRVVLSDFTARRSNLQPGPRGIGGGISARGAVRIGGLT